MIYLIETETNNILNGFENVLNWDVNFVEYLNGGFLSKIYAVEGTYFADEQPITEESEQ